MLGLAFLVGAIALGLALAWSIPARLTFEERVAIGVPVGLAAAASGAFVLALAMGLSDGTVAVAIVAALAGAAVLARRAPARARASAEWADAGRRVVGGELTGFVLVFAAFAAILVFLFWQSLQVDGGGTMRIRPETAWGDWQVHLGQTTSFAYGDNVPPEAPTMAGVSLPYPFLVNFLSGILLEGGMGLLAAMKVPVAILAVAGVALLMLLARHVAGAGAALLAPPLFYLAGGLGFVNFLSDVGDGAALASLPHRYTLVQPGAGGQAIDNLWWANPTFAYVFPQRSFLFGLPLVLASVLLVLHARRDRSRGTMLAAGLVAVLLPLVHTHGLLVLGLAATTLAVLGLRRTGIRDTVRQWLPLALPAVALALPITVWLTSGADGTHVRWKLGWMTNDDLWPWFWIKNTGAFIPAAVAGVLLHRRRHPQLARTTLAAGAVFAVANTIGFQDNLWDNTKLFAYACALAVPAAAAFLVWLNRRGLAGTVAAATLLVSLTFAGALDASHTLGRSYSVPLFGREAQALAAAIRTQTDPDARFVTGQAQPNEIHTLAGRSTLLGPLGWVRTWGIEPDARLVDVARIYRGGPAALRLLRRYHVDYVAIGKIETHRDYVPDVGWFAARFPLRWQSDDLRIYDVRAVSRRASAPARG